MEASEVLKRYANGERDFRRTDLRGQSFKGQDLSRADFSEAQIQGANFTGAMLREVTFTGAKAGVQTYWTVTQFIVFFLLTAPFSFIGAAFNVFAISYFFQGSTTKQIGYAPGVFLFLAISVVFLAIAQQGFTARTAKTIAFAFAFVGAFAFTGVAISAPINSFVGQYAFAVAFTSAFTVALTVALACTFTGTYTFVGVLVGLVVASIGTSAFAGALPYAFAGSVSGLGLYVARKTAAGDEKFALIRSFGVVFATLGGTCFYAADLTAASFSHTLLKSANFNRAKLTQVCWSNAKAMDRARVGNSILVNPAVRDLLVQPESGYKKSFVGMNLEGANLRGANLEQSNLRCANLSQADLQHANLKDANMREVLAIGANFTGAYLTGACLEAWNIDHTTKIENVDCQFIFLLDQPNAIGSRERRPPNPDRVFQPGDFAKLYQEMMNPLQILLHNGVNQEAFAQAVQNLMQENPEIDRHSIQATKQENDVLLTLEVSSTADKAKISQDFLNPYEERVRQLETEVNQLHSLHSTDLKDILLALATNPITIQAVGQGIAMNDNIKRSIHIGGNVTGSTLNLGEISGNVTNSLNQLQQSATPQAAELADLLKQLQSAIETDADLPEKGKATALEQVNVLAEVAKDPQPDKKPLGQQAVNVLKSAASFLPDTAKLADACSKLLPLIAKALGLG